MSGTGPNLLQKSAISVARRLGVAVPQSSMALGTASSVLRWLAGVFATCSATCSSVRQPSTPSKLAISERLPGGVADDELGFGFLGGPRWREAARAHFLQSSSSRRFVAGGVRVLYITPPQRR